LNIKSDGNWTYAPDNANPVVNALLTGNLQEQFTYSISDGKGGTASATLTVQINGSNDAPVAVDDYNIAKEFLTATAGVGYTATGNVLPNDSDVDSGDTKAIVGLNETGAATAGTYTASGASTTLTFTTSQNIGSVSNGSQVFWDQNGDGEAGTKPVALAVSNGAATPTFTPVTVSTGAPGSVGGTTDFALSATPTHYWTGAAWVAFTNVETQLSSGSRYFEFGAANGNVAANSAKGGVLVADGAEVTVSVDITGASGSIYAGMAVTALNGATSVLPVGTLVTKVNYNGSGNISAI
jgi:VCBS repeat-containing protein